MQPETLRRACKNWLSEVKRCKKWAPCILVGTKQDLRDELEREVATSGETEKLQNHVTSKQITMVCKKYDFQAHVYCSAKENQNMDSLFHTAFDLVLQQW